MIYYKLEVDENNVIIAINSSDEPFDESGAITVDSNVVDQIRVGRTKLNEIPYSAVD